MTATILILPGSVAFAAHPTSDSAAAVAAYQSDYTLNFSPVLAETERRCLIRCNDPNKPPPGARLQEAATKAKTAVQETAQDVRVAAQDAKADVREAAADVKEVAGRAKEVVANATDNSDEDQESQMASSSQAASPEPAPQVARSEAPAPAEAPASSAAPVPAVAEAPTTVASSGAPAASAAGLTQAPSSAPVAQTDPSQQPVARRPDGVAGGPNASTQRTEPGTFGQAKAPEAAVPAQPAPPVVAAASPGAPPPTIVEPAAPVAAQAPPVAPAVTAPPVVPPAPAAAPEPPRVASNPPGVTTDADDAEDSSDSSTIELAGWSVPVPLAVAGGLMAGAAIMVPLSRRRQPATLPSGRQDRALSYPAASPAPAYHPTPAPRPDNRPVGYPGEHLTIGDSIVRSETLHTLRPVNNAYTTSPSVRLNGAPVPYLQPVRSAAVDQRDQALKTNVGTRPGYSTNVSGLAWPEPSTDARGDRALA